jgi:hypothetical protein
MIGTESTKQRVRSHRLPIERGVTGLAMHLYGEGRYSRPQKGRCRNRSTYGCRECFGSEETAEFARNREATGRMMYMRII